MPKKKLAINTGMSLVEMCEKIFLLSEGKMKFSIEQKVFIVRIYYATKSYKKCGKNCR